jgi:nitrite reductase/ring-hydroxylating ferredoxin subunit
MSFQNTCPWSQRHCNSIQNVLVPDHNEIVCDFKTHVYLITTALYFISKHMSLITTTLYFNPKRTCPWSQRHCMWFQDARVPDHNNIVFPFTKYLSLITTTLYVISRRTCLLSQRHCISFQNTCPWSQQHCISIQNVFVPDHNDIVCDFKTHVSFITGGGE